MRNPTLEELPSPASSKSGWPWTKESPSLPDRMPDDLSWPRICVVTPSYNQGQYIEETIRSVLLQGYPDLEYIVMDGGSTDNTVEVIRKYEPWLAYWVSEPDGGQAVAVNAGWRRASGTILSWLNSDDCYFPSAFQKVAQKFAGDEQLRVLAGEGVLVDNNWNRITAKPTPSFDPVTLLLHTQPLQPTTFYRHDVLSEVGFLDETLHYSMDRDFFLRLGHRYFPERTAYLNSYLAYAYEWSGAKSSIGIRNARYEFNKVVDKFITDPDTDKIYKRYRRKAYRQSYLLWARNISSAGHSFGEFYPLFMALLHSRNLKEYKHVLRHFKALIKFT